MHGIGIAHGAITIVNALPTGVGAAVGVDLSARAEIDLRPAGTQEKWQITVPAEARTPLVLGTLASALRRFAPGSSGTGALNLQSDIPPGRGLKSSSAVSSAIALAVARATRAAVAPEEIARLSADASIEAGVSATGAFDDALAGLSSGVIVTDNLRRERLAAFSIEGDWRVGLYIPPASHPAAPGLSRAFSDESEAGRRAADAARTGDWPRAMQLNSELVERVLGYDYGPVRAELRRRGAYASGVSGLGPTLAVVASADRLDAVMAGLPDGPAERRVVPFASALIARGRPA